MSTTSIGQIGLDLVVNRKKFNKQMTDIQSLAKKTGKLLAGAFAVKGIVDFGKKCIDLGSDLAEVQNVVDVTFTTMSDKVDSFAKRAAASFGLSETMAKKYTGTFGAMAKAFGFSEQAAYDMGTTLTGLAGDVASFYNITQEEAYTKLKSVFTGETETLKDLGVVMTQSALDAYALANGFGKTTKSMSEAEKVALRYAFVQNQLSAATGDFTRTSGSWANQVKVLKLQLESFMSSVGQGFINLFTPAIQIVNNLVGKLLTLGNAFKSLTEIITGKTQSSMSSSISGITESASAAQGAVTGIGDAAEKAAKKAKGLSGIDELNNLSSSSTASVGSSAGDASIDTGIVTDPTSGIDGKNVDGLAGKFKKLTDALDKFKESASKLAGTIKDGLGWCYDNILKPFGNWVMNKAAPKILELFGAALEALNEILLALQPLWQWAWDKFLKPLAEYVGDKFIQFLDTMTGLLNDFSDWCSTHQTTVQNIAIVVGSLATAWGLLNIAVGLWNAIGTIATTVTTAFGIAVQFLTSPIGIVIVSIGTLIAVCALLVRNWDKVKDTAERAWKRIKETFSPVGDWFKKQFGKAYDSITQKFTAIGQFFENLYEKIKKKFIDKFGTKIGDAIGKAFKAAMNSAISVVENKINQAVTLINGAIGFINKIPGVKLNKIKPVVLPKLAEGGYVKANTPQLAIIGDNRHQGEVVAPENKLEEMALKAAQKSGAGKNVDLQVIITLLQKQNELLMAILEKEVGISERDIFDSVRKSAETYKNRTGNPAFSY